MKKRYIRNILRLLISGGLFFFLILKFKVNISGIVTFLQNPYILTICLIISIIIIPFLAAWRWKIILRITNLQEGIISLLKINFLSIFWGFLMPSADGFALIRIYLLEKKHASNSGFAGSSVIWEKYLGLIILLSIVFCGSFFADDYLNTTILRLLLIFFYIMFSVIFFLLKGTWLTSLFNSWYKKTKIRIFLYFYNLSRAIKKFRLQNTLPLILFPIISIQLLAIFTVYLIFIAFNLNIPFHIHLVLLPLIQLISLFPITVGGFGLREGAFIYFYGFFDVQPELAFTISILYFLILTGIPAFIGGLISMREQIYSLKSE